MTFPFIFLSILWSVTASQFEFSAFERTSGTESANEREKIIQAAAVREINFRNSNFIGHSSFAGHLKLNLASLYKDLFFLCMGKSFSENRLDKMKKVTLQFLFDRFNHNMHYTSPGDGGKYL